MGKFSIISEYFEFLKSTRKWWLIFIVIFLLILGVLIIFVQNSMVAPFIYTLF